MDDLRLSKHDKATVYLRTYYGMSHQLPPFDIFFRGSAIVICQLWGGFFLSSFSIFRCLVRFSCLLLSSLILELVGLGLGFFCFTGGFFTAQLYTIIIASGLSFAFFFFWEVSLFLCLSISHVFIRGFCQT